MSFLRTKIRDFGYQSRFHMLALCINWDQPWTCYCWRIGWATALEFGVCPSHWASKSCNSLIFLFPKSSLVPDTKVHSKHWIGECFWINFKKLNIVFPLCVICIAPESYKVQEKKTGASSRPSAVSGQNSNYSGSKPGTIHVFCCRKKVIPKALMHAGI